LKSAISVFSCLSSRSFCGNYFTNSKCYPFESALGFALAPHLISSVSKALRRFDPRPAPPPVGPIPCTGKSASQLEDLGR
jgi:hypothetical protein